MHTPHPSTCIVFRAKSRAFALQVLLEHSMQEHAGMKIELRAALCAVLIDLQRRTEGVMGVRRQAGDVPDTNHCTAEMRLPLPCSALFP